MYKRQVPHDIYVHVAGIDIVRVDAENFYVLDNIEDLVIKEVHGSGGYGMLIGPKADKVAVAAFRAKLKSDPRNFIAQPTLALSTCPTCVEEGIAPRHVDLRPFCLLYTSRCV